MCISLGLSCLGFSALPELGWLFHFPWYGSFQLFKYFWIFKYFPRSFPSLFCPSGTPIMQILMHLVLSQRSLRVSSFLFILFSLSHESDFHHSVFQFTYPFFCLSYSAIDYFSVFFISVIVLSISVYSLVLLGLCYTFFVSQSVPHFFFRDLGSSLLSLLWILFWIDCLISSSFSCYSGVLFYLLPSSGSCFSAVSFCLTCCDWDFSSASCRVGCNSSCFYGLLPGGWNCLRGLYRLPGGR